MTPRHSSWTLFLCVFVFGTWSHLAIAQTTPPQEYKPANITFDPLSISAQGVGIQFGTWGEFVTMSRNGTPPTNFRHSLNDILPPIDFGTYLYDPSSKLNMLSYSYTDDRTLEHGHYSVWHSDILHIGHRFILSIDRQLMATFAITATLTDLDHALRTYNNMTPNSLSITDNTNLSLWPGDEIYATLDVPTRIGEFWYNRVQSDRYVVGQGDKVTLIPPNNSGIEQVLHLGGTHIKKDPPRARRRPTGGSQHVQRPFCSRHKVILRLSEQMR